MKIAITVAVTAAVLAWAAPDAMAQGKKGAKAQCLNPLVCGPQPVKQIRKPKNEKFMRSAS